MKEKIVQTAGREQLGEFAPMFAHHNDDVLFGEVWNGRATDEKTKCIITVVALMSSGITDTSLVYHLQNAKSHDVTKEEIVTVVTHVGMYVGWPKAWAVFRLAKEVWNDACTADTGKDSYQNSIFFPVGDPNNAFSKYFIRQSYLAPVSGGQLPIFNVTFEPSCRNNWHIHHAKSGGGQILICVGGHGFYREWGNEPIEMTPGTVVNIQAGVKHWHGAAENEWFSHLAIEVPGEDAKTEWLEPVDDQSYLDSVRTDKSEKAMHDTSEKVQPTFCVTADFPIVRKVEKRVSRSPGLRVFRVRIFIVSSDFPLIFFKVNMTVFF